MAQGNTRGLQPRVHMVAGACASTLSAPADERELGVWLEHLPTPKTNRVHTETLWISCWSRLAACGMASSAPRWADCGDAVGPKPWAMTARPLATCLAVSTGKVLRRLSFWIALTRANGSNP